MVSVQPSLAGSPCRLFFAVVVLSLLHPTRVMPQAGAELSGRIVREIRITGLKHTKRKLVVDQLASEAGQPYTL